MSLTYHLHQNRLRAILPAENFEHLAAQLELVQLPLGQTIYESGEESERVLFPTTSIISLILILESGLSAELAIVGNEGMVGISLLPCGQSTPSLAVVQTAGSAYLLPGHVVKTEFDRAVVLKRLLLRHTPGASRPPADQGAEMTHALVANALGGRSDAATRLRKAGIVSYRGGHTSVLKRPELEARACECYAVVKREPSRLLTEASTGQPDTRPARAHSVRDLESALSRTARRRSRTATTAGRARSPSRSTRCARS